MTRLEGAGDRIDPPIGDLFRRLVARQAQEQARVNRVVCHGSVAAPHHCLPDLLLAQAEHRVESLSDDDLGIAHVLW